MPKNKPYVAHDCRNPACNSRWLAQDDTGVTSRPPKNKYCPDCELVYTNKKDPARVARGKVLAETAKQKRCQDSWWEDL